MSAKSSIIPMLIALLLIAVILPFSQASGADMPLPDLLGPALDTGSTIQLGGAEQRARTAVLNQVEVVRTRADLDAGRTPGALALNLFADTSLVARFERIEHLQSGGYTLVGKIDGSPFGEIHLSVVGSALYASLNTPQGLFRIASPDGQTAKITQVDPRLLPPEEELVPVAAPAAADPLAPMTVTSGPTTGDDGSRIDVYVGYTTAAKNLAGGLAGIQSVIATAIAETNTGYANSGINQRVVLVGSGEYAYSETGFNWNTALSQWSNPADAVFGPAHTLRDTLKADEMVLLVTDPAYCGLAWLMGSGSVSTSFAGSSFALVNWTCATGYYSFAHEMGHNMGAHHDRYSAGGGQGAFNYSYGFWILNPATSHYDWRTVMAYNTATAYGYNSVRINYWSNPLVAYNGQATGISELAPQSANNALTLNNTAPVVAQFRDGASPAAPTNLVATPLGVSSVKLDWVNVGTDLMKNRIERSLAGTNTWSELAIIGSSAITYTDSLVPDGNAYQYRILSDNGNGRTSSNIANLPAVPAAPVALTAAGASQTAVRLDWTDNATSEDGYKVERGPFGGAFTPLATVVGANGVTYTDASIPASGDFQYRVYAYNARGGSAFSGAAPVPAKPTAIANTVVNNSRIDLSWTDNSGIESGYKIERSLDGGATWTLLTTLSSPNTQVFSDTAAACGVNSYRVYAYGPSGNSAYAATSGTTRPCKPVVTAGPGTTTVYLSWAAASGAEGYSVDIWDTDTPQYLVIKNLSLADPTGYRVTGLTKSVPYRFRVVAKSALGDTPSDPVDVVTMNFDAFLPLAVR